MDHIAPSRAPLVLAFLFALVALASPAHAQGQQAQQEKLKQLKDMAPAHGYIKAHKDVEQPFDLLGGPITATITQESGGVFVALPAQRELDPYVFGTPQMPRAFAGTPGVNGVPPMARDVADGAYTRMKQPSPFGDKYVVMADGRLNLTATDATATDAATTKDELQMQASWKDEAGNTYEVRCCAMLASHGMEFPTFGGVVTNHILHGFSRIGTALMPSEYTYLAFWGMGEVRKNGEVLEQPRLIHGMLTEYVRTEGYQLASDEEVTPTRRHFHLMVAPFMPVPEELSFTHKPVKTGFTLPNGMELPFWHVMFENLEISAER
ncbi:MAG: hypothetical protein GVY18_06685 [Bacteroidetes bacterium]|jgi:hypothetical protein|nr:hypothetical protein [Bacteroidota bacterium]